MLLGFACRLSIHPNLIHICRLLTGIKITSLDSLRAALSTFHDLYSIPHIIISSIPSSQVPELPPDTLVCAGSSRPQGSKVAQQFVIPFPSLPEHYEGVGDVFSSLVLANFQQEQAGEPCPLSRTAERAIASLQGILMRTRQHALSLAAERQDLTGTNPAETPEERIRRLKLVELRLVHSWREIKEPNVVYRAKPLA